MQAGKLWLEGSLRRAMGDAKQFEMESDNLRAAHKNSQKKILNEMHGLMYKAAGKMVKVQEVCCMMSLHVVVLWPTAWLCCQCTRMQPKLQFAGQEEA